MASERPIVPFDVGGFQGVTHPFPPVAGSTIQCRVEDAPQAAARSDWRKTQILRTRKEKRPMKKTMPRKLHLSRETLHQLLEPSALRAAPGGASFPVTACGNFTCPPVCTLARPCAG